MTMMKNLPQDMVEEIISRVPLTSLRRVWSTCKNRNILSKDGTFTKKHLAQALAENKGEILTILLINRKLSLMCVNLHNQSITHRGNLISVNDLDKLDITQVYHCDGLLLCGMVDYPRLVVWNPYSGQTRWISVEPISNHRYNHALGHNHSSSTHKVLRFVHPNSGKSMHEIFYVNSNSWRVLDVTSD